MKRTFWIFALLALLALLVSACAAPVAPAADGGAAAEGEAAAASGEPVTLTILTHWGEESLATPMQAKLDAYMAANPNVTIEYQAVTFDQLLTKITTARAAGASPDIIHFYNLWMPDFVEGGMLAEPPADLLAEIQANYSEGTIGAVSYGGQVWGVPTELNTYQLIYNKQMLADAGVTPPTTLAELKEAACALKVVGDDGTVQRAGLVLLTGWDSGVVHPYVSLLWSAGGEYLAEDLSVAEFNSAEGAEVAQAYVDMVNEQCVDPALGAMTNFAEGKGAMMIVANFFRSTLQTSMEGGYENVGVAPIPTSNDGQSTTVQYNWLWGVDAASPNQAEAWKFIQWMNSPAAEGEASPMGDYLTSALGAIPSRLSDQEALADRLSDEFMTAFVGSASTARPEPVLRGGQEIKTALQQGIEATWYGQKDVATALADAETEANRILSENQ